MIELLAAIQLYTSHICYFFPFASDLPALIEATGYSDPASVADEICARASNLHYGPWGSRLEVNLLSVAVEVEGYIQEPLSYGIRRRSKHGIE